MFETLLGDRLVMTTDGELVPKSEFREEFSDAGTQFTVQMIARAAYVLSWMAFEDLLASCIRLAYTKNPRRLIDRSAEKNNLKLVKMIIDEDATRDQLVTEMIEREVRAVHALGLKEVARYFRTNLNMDWEESWLDALVKVAARRNEAAHDVRFKAPPIEMMTKELSALLEYGVRIGALCAKTYDAPLDLGWSSLAEFLPKSSLRAFVSKWSGKLSSKWSEKLKDNP